MGQVRAERSDFSAVAGIFRCVDSILPLPRFEQNEDRAEKGVLLRLCVHSAIGFHNKGNQRLSG